VIAEAPDDEPVIFDEVTLCRKDGVRTGGNASAAT